MYGTGMHVRMGNVMTLCFSATYTLCDIGLASVSH